VAYLSQLEEHLALNGDHSVVVRVGRKFINLMADGTEREEVTSRAYVEGGAEDAAS
jgi:hypothetical protein